MENSNEFSVTPMNQMVDLMPGETYTFSITVLNPVNSAGSLDYRAYAVPYRVVTEEYDADITTMTDRTQMADWITIKEPTGTLVPNETREIEFTVQVPEDAPGGGQYAAIMVGSDNENGTYENMKVTNVLEIASIVYAKVEGEIVHEGGVLENNVPGFLVNPPATVSTLINNTGNMHEAADIVVTAQNVFTGEVLVSPDLDNGTRRELIMPDSTKFVSMEIDDLPLVGIVKVTQSVYYNSEVSTVEKNLIICPIWFLALVLLTVSAIVIKVVKTVRKHKKKKMVQKKQLQ